ncbi:MAG: hypothetical protein FJ298_13165 [Planctomycetes bacterium]|nr:hypothetical protein [Planctomycetota bacterium]
MSPTRPLLLSLLLMAPNVARSTQATSLERTAVAGELVLEFDSELAPDARTLVSAWDLAATGMRITSARELLGWQRRGSTRRSTVALVEFEPRGADHERLAAALRREPGVRWVCANMALEGDPRELVPNDPQYGSQYHHPLMRNDLAWNVTAGSAAVIVGITDDGVDRSHQDLAQGIWVNPLEIAGNNIDDDANGYVDDINGWDFVFDTNNPSPDNGNDHGTHVAGIAAARTNNGVGVAGTAGGATIQPLQFYASGQPWTAANIAEAFAYGVDNGARILSTSYNIDGWVGDPTVTAAFDYLYDHGALHFNSAGNNSAANPPRQAFHQTLLVASTDAADLKSSFSNYGTGIDVASPGSSILSTLLSNGYGSKSGTSMATPNAAGVAALVWSAHPTWTRDQVAAQVVASADDIDAFNPALAGLLGGGRVNSFRAVSLALPAPRVADAVGLPAEGATASTPPASFDLRFNQILDPQDVNAPGAFTLTYAGADAAFGTADDAPVSLGWGEYLIGSNFVRFGTVGSMAASGLYRFTARADLLSNPFGAALDGDGDGVGGDAWTRTFAVCGSTAILVDPAESGADWSVVNENLSDGPWTQVPEVPVGGGVRNDPPTDFDGSGRCFLTDNVSGNSDVDGGPTRLVSRAFNLVGISDPHLSFARWLVSDGADVMSVDISANNGSSWIPAMTLTSVAGWRIETLRVASLVTPSSQVRLRFSVADLAPGSITEAGIDYLRVLQVDCTNLPVGTSYCTAATNSSGASARIRAVGSPRVAHNQFTLYTDGVPAGKSALFYFGPSTTATPFGNGWRCVSGITSRIQPPLLASPANQVVRQLDLGTFPLAGAALPGATLHFQCWYRDPNAGGSNFNLSDGLSVIWQ